MKILKSKIILFILVELFILILLAKAYFINTIFIDHENTFLYRYYQSIANDSIIYFLIVFLIYISYQNFVNKALEIFLRVFSLIIFALYTTDIVILFKFANHLVLNDVIKYLIYAPTYIMQQYSFNIIDIAIITFSIFLFLSFVLNDFKIKRKIVHFYFISNLCILFLMYLSSDKGRYIHSWLFKNFISYNLEIYDQSKTYSKKFIDELNYQEELSCIKTKAENPNIIILMVESLSSYQSNYFSNIKNWTPNLDKIAKENLSFKNFYANGFVTEDAEISILTGELPIYAPNIFSNGGGVSFEGFFNLKDSLPYILKNKEYFTEFITSSDLEFSHTGKWAKSIGFDYIEGSEHPYYSNKPRYHFEAAADEFLYDRVLNRIDQKSSKYFLFIKTVSSHAPFINPENNSNSEEETILYTDKQIGRFYNELQKRNFFDDGLLVILGDHHPIVPMIISYKQNQGILNTNFQQTDIYNTLKNLVSTKACTSQWLGDFLTYKYKSADYILHRRGDQRGIISIFKNDDDFNIKLHGDKTNFIENKFSDKNILDKINHIRIKN
jgi:hypothetical protein